MIKFGKRKDGQAYPKIKNHSIRKGTIKHSGKIIRAKGYWAKGDSNYSDFAWALKDIKSIINRREKIMKIRFDNLEYELKISNKQATIEYFGTSHDKLVDHFKIKRGRNGLWGIKNMPKKYDYKR